MVAQIITASIYLIRMPFSVIVNGVYVFDRWTKPDGDTCPLITRGHSLLLVGCGSNALSLKGFFSAAELANQLLFRTLAIVTRAFRGMPGVAMPTTFINGVAMYSMDTMDPLIAAVVGGDMIKKALDVPVQKTLMDMLMSALR